MSLFSQPCMDGFSIHVLIFNARPTSGNYRAQGPRWQGEVWARSVGGVALACEAAQSAASITAHVPSSPPHACRGHRTGRAWVGTLGLQREGESAQSFAWARARRRRGAEGPEAGCGPVPPARTLTTRSWPVANTRGGHRGRCPSAYWRVQRTTRVCAT